MPQLDSLRAIAVFAVFCEHFSFTPAYLTQHIHFGRLGVSLFFMLSGFLITQILLKEQMVRDKNQSTGFLLMRTFYLRRALRIFPIYYLMLLLLLCLRYPPAIGHIALHFAYASNIGMCFWNLNFGHLNHLWSLCVEEQFYLVWPLVIIFLPRRGWLWFMAGLILLGPAYKFLGALYGCNWITLTRNPLGGIETLVGGALLACLRHLNLQRAENALCRWGCWLGWPLLITLQIARGSAFHSTEVYRIAYVALLDIVSMLAFLPVLSLTSRGVKEPWGRILDIPLLRYIGKISYGIYLYHLPLNPVLKDLLPLLGIAPPLPGIVLLTLHFAAAVAVASISWHLIEKPLASLKRKIPYPSQLG